MVTKTEIERMKPRQKKYLVSIGDTLYLSVYPTGRKTWIQRIKTGNTDSIKTIGTYPEMSLDDARVYVLSKKEINSSDRTFRSWAEEWLNARKTPVDAKVTIKGINSRLNIHIYPRFGDRPIREITTRSIIEFADRLEKAEKFATARRCVGIIGEIMRYASRTDDSVTDATKGVFEGLAPRVTEHFARLSKPNEIGMLMNKIDSYPSLITKLALKFVAYTFVRFKNVREAEWSEIDGDVWRIPGDKMKNGETHIVPISRQVKDILDRMAGITDRKGYIFVSPRDLRSMIGEDSLLHAIRRMGYTPNEMTIHGFRGMASTILYESNRYTREAIELQLAHSETNSVVAAYNYASYMDVRKEMVQWYADTIDSYKLLTNSI